MMAILLTLSGCSSQAATITPTPVVNTPTPTTQDIPTETQSLNIKIVTLAENNQTMTLNLGETFLLDLGSDYTWTVNIDQPDVLSRLPNILVIKGAQGVYKGNQAGTANLTANGDPACLQSKPACALPSILFSLEVVVNQS
jgi:uncharacterized protein YceK